MITLLIVLAVVAAISSHHSGPSPIPRAAPAAALAPSPTPPPAFTAACERLAPSEVGEGTPTTTWSCHIFRVVDQDLYNRTDGVWGRVQGEAALNQDGTFNQAQADRNRYLCGPSSNAVYDPESGACLQ